MTHQTYNLMIAKLEAVRTVPELSTLKTKYTGLADNNKLMQRTIFFKSLKFNNGAKVKGVNGIG